MKIKSFNERLVGTDFPLPFEKVQRSTEGSDTESLLPPQKKGRLCKINNWFHPRKA